MPHELMTLGYSSCRPKDLVTFSEARDAIVVDIRFAARSRNPAWSKSSLQTALGTRYLHIRALGNVNYKDGPIHIADLGHGLSIVNELLDTSPVILLCVCSDVNTCHRKVVADAMLRLHHIEAVHLQPADLDKSPEQPSLL